MSNTNISEWMATFSCVPEKIPVANVVSFESINLVTESNGTGIVLVSIKIKTPKLSFIEAVNYSKLLANRCADIISSMIGTGVSFSFKQITELPETPGQFEKTTFFQIGYQTSFRLEVIDMTKFSILEVFSNKNAKLARQLSHYRRALLSSDPINQIKEFYLVIEDEYGRNDNRTKEFRYLRNLLSHSELENKASKSYAISTTGKPYFDPSAPKDLELLIAHIPKIKSVAETIIKGKLK